MKSVLRAALLLPLCLLAVLLVLLVGIRPALAAEVDIKPLLDLGIQILAAVLLAAGTVLIPKLLKRFNLDIDVRQRDAINSAMAAAINYGMGKASSLAGKVGPIEVKNAAAAAGAQYLISKVPDALKHFDITPEKLAEMIKARLPADEPKPAG